MRSHHGTISLAPLDHEQVRHMVSELAARHALPTDVIEGVTERTGGVPLFVEEVTRLLLERGEQGGIQAIPPTLQQSLTARLDRLGPAREVAQIGAVIGRGFSYPLLRAVAGMEDAALQTALERLAEAAVLHRFGCEGRWKMVIIFHLFDRLTLKFSELERTISVVSQKMAAFSGPTVANGALRAWLDLQLTSRPEQATMRRRSRTRGRNVPRKSHTMRKAVRRRGPSFLDRKLKVADRSTRRPRAARGNGGQGRYRRRSSPPYNSSYRCARPGP